MKWTFPRHEKARFWFQRKFFRECMTERHKITVNSKWNAISSRLKMKYFFPQTAESVYGKNYHKIL